MNLKSQDKVSKVLALKQKLTQKKGCAEF